MITGVGTDIVRIDRIARAMMKNENFIPKLFTEKEMEYLKSKGCKGEHVAGRFAAKEAVSKALGTGIRGFGFRDIEIMNDELGKPMVTLYGRAKEHAENKGEYEIHLSISHESDNAIAFAIMETK